MPKDLRARMWPHFMEKKYLPKEQIYISRKVLGQLYDLVERVDFVPRYDTDFDRRILEAYELKESDLQVAREIKNDYDIELRRILAQQSIETEFEIWSTFAVSYAGPSRNYKLHEELGRIAAALKDRYRLICQDRAGDKHFKVLGPFVAAMYRVTYDEVVAARTKKPGNSEASKEEEGEEEPSMTAPRDDDPKKKVPLISFPWCFWDVLGRIANAKKAPTKKPDGGVVDAPTGKAVAMEDEKPIDVGTTNVVETAGRVTHPGEVLELFHGEGGQ